MRLITTLPVLQDLMSLDPPGEVDGEVKARSCRPHSAASARGSLFTVTLNFLLSIVSWTSDGKGGRNRDNLIALKIPNKPEQRLSAPNLSFLEAVPGATCTTQVPRDPNISASPSDFSQMGGPARNCLGLAAEARCKLLGPRNFQHSFGALWVTLHWGHSVASTLPSPRWLWRS